MTPWRRSRPRRPARPARPVRHARHAAPAPPLARAAAGGVCAALLAGCGILPGDVGGVKEITVMTWAPSTSEAGDQAGMPAMAQAYARWVNTSGGIAGHRLKVLTCEEGDDSVKAARCAERAERAGVVAVVGSYSQHGRAFMPALESSGIPYIGGYGVTQEELSSPWSYPVNGGLAALVAGSGRQLAAAGCERVAVVRPDTATGDQYPPLLATGLREGGAEQATPVTDIRTAPDATEYSSAAAEALAGGASSTDCVSALLGGRTSAFLDSFRRQPQDTTSVVTAGVLGSIRQSLVDRTGGAESPLEGAYATSWYPAADDPRWDRMEDAVKAHAFGDNRIDTADPGVQTTWVAYTVLRAAVEAAAGGPEGDGEITARSVRTALDDNGPFPTGGLTPELGWRFEDLLAAEYPRAVNTAVIYQQVRDGRLVAVRKKPVDVTSTLEGGKTD